MGRTLPVYASGHRFGNKLIVYGATKHDSLKDNNDREIDDVIRSSLTQATGHRVSQNEQRSWRESLSYMAKVSG